jgi:hypothetical protein
MNAVKSKASYIQSLINDASPGERVVLPRGIYEIAIYIDKSLTLTGSGNTSDTTLKGVTDGGSVIVIVEDGLNITIENITIVGGFDLKGGGISVKGNSNLTIRNCIIQNNSATYYGGGGVYMADGELTIIRSRIIKNAAVIGGGILIDGDTQATLKSSLISENAGQRAGGGFCLTESSTAKIINCTFADNAVVEGTGQSIYLRGSMSNQPSVKIMNCILREQEADNSIGVNDCGGSIEILHTLMSPGHEEKLELKVDRNNLYVPINFVSSEREIYLLSYESPGITLGNPKFLKSEDRDLLGQNWASDTEDSISVGAYKIIPITSQH